VEQVGFELQSENLKESTMNDGDTDDGECDRMK